VSRRLACLNFLLRHIVKARLRRVETPAEVRRDFDLAARLLFKPWGTRLVRTADWTEVTNGPADPGRVILYFHGGGYVAGSAFTHREMLGRLAKLTSLRIVAPDYRLAPEHPLPLALEDAVTAWERLLAQGHRAGDIVLAGDSAGGGLALSLLAVLCGRGTAPGAVVVFSPWTDLTGSGASITENAEVDPIFPGERLPDLAGFTLGDVPPEDPRISPLFADFPGAPPVLIQVGLTEILRDDSRRMADRLRSFGAEVALETWPDTPHVWQMFGFLPETRAALGSAARFLQLVFTARR
jgi:acetyl esterase/lipase